jgi:toxin CcdB
MAQFDVYANPVARARGQLPLVAVLQSDRVEGARERVVAPLVRRRHYDHAPVAGRLTPPVDVAGKDYVLLIPALTTLPAGELRRPVGNIAHRRNDILAAVDYLFLGV